MTPKLASIRRCLNFAPKTCSGVQRGLVVDVKHLQIADARVSDRRMPIRNAVSIVENTYRPLPFVLVVLPLTACGPYRQRWCHCHSK